MVLTLARDSIILKCMRNHNSILGNYECAYALGLMSRLSGIALPEGNTDLKMMLNEFLEKSKGYKSVSEEERRLLHILAAYHPAAELDEQAMELLKWGMTEEHPWKI